MRKPLKRYYGHGHLHFLTFSCYRRRPLLSSVRARNLVVKILAEVRARYDFGVVGYVLMPEHVHLLISVPAKGTPSKVVQVLKQRVSRALRAKTRRSAKGQLALKFPDAADGLRRFWQRRFFDFNVYSGRKLRQKLDYMHRNPLVRKLVEHPKDWPWSSWSFYEKGERGLLKIDFGE
jgi:putative transposase